MYQKNCDLAVMWKIAHSSKYILPTLAFFLLIWMIELTLNRPSLFTKQHRGGIATIMHASHSKETKNFSSITVSSLTVPQTPMPPIDGTNVIAMSLYGSDPRYTEGALRNAEQAKENFPGWKLRIYMKATNKPKLAVPQGVISNLSKFGVDIHYINPVNNTIPPMMWRFLVADDMQVDRFIVRDSDSRLTTRDAAAVKAWVESNKPFNCIRDHPSHAGFAISGGMWGGKPRELHDILGFSWEKTMQGRGANYLNDMHFLNSVVWPKVKENHTYCSDSVSCEKYPGSHPFPVIRVGYEHVGQVMINNVGRASDIDILKKRGDNPKCVPKLMFNITK